jgi:hypothetical protein
MKKSTATLIVSAIWLALLLASPAEAAQASKRKKPVTAHSATQRHAVAAPRPAFQGGVLAGPVYNGQDYIGDDPDPHIRAFIRKDFGSRYGGAF